MVFLLNSGWSVMSLEDVGGLPGLWLKRLVIMIQLDGVCGGCNPKKRFSFNRIGRALMDRGGTIGLASILSCPSITRLPQE